MKILRDNYNNIINNEEITLTIGNFDGVHLGHQQLIKKVLSYSDTKHALMTFSPHPMKVLRDISFKEISSLDQKIEFLKPFNLDYLFIVNFNEAFYKLSKEAFINFLKSIKVKRLVIGKDFRFGINASGSLSDLVNDFDIVIVDDEKRGQIRISTTYIKDLIRETKLDEAEKMLSRKYQIKGKVIDGDKVGRTLGIPTANLLVENFVLPNNGVYFVVVIVDGKKYGGALNIGYNPTINYSVTKRVEVHILDFDEFIYGKEVTLVFYKYLRPELQFSNKEILIKQLVDDVSLCKKMFSSVI